MKDSLFFRKAGFWDFFCAFLFILGVFFFIRAYGQEFLETPQGIIYLECLTSEDRKYYEEKLEFHMENANRTWTDAKNKCAMLPDREDRENAKYCFTTLITILAANNPRHKCIALIVTALTEYGLSAINEWHYINNKLHWCEYHWEMVDFYRNLLWQNP